MKLAFQMGMFPETSTECAMCTGGEEDCSQLFLKCTCAPAI